MARIMITALGVQHRQSKYIYGGTEVEAPLSPLAVLHLYRKIEKELPDKIVVLCTQATRQPGKDGADSSFDVLQRELAEHFSEVEFQPLDVPDGDQIEQFGKIMSLTAREVSEGDTLILEVTQGFRHFSFIFYSLALYLSSLRGVTLENAWYGKLEGNKGEPAPLMDMKAILLLPQLSHATQVFRDTGSAIPLAKSLKFVEERDITERPKLKKLESKLVEVSQAYLASAPLELGAKACLAAKAMNDAVGSELLKRLPLGEDLKALLEENLNLYSLGDTTDIGKSWKANVVLNWEELRRQANIIDVYIEREQYPQAVGLIREWMVSRCMLEQGWAEQWLNLDAKDEENGKTSESRKSAADWLFENQKDDWTLIGQTRNELMHQGMRQNVVKFGESRSVEKVRGVWAREKESMPRA